MRTTSAFVLFLLAILIPISASEQELDSCPPNSSEVREERSGGQIVGVCRCNPGFVRRANSCEPTEPREQQPTASKDLARLLELKQKLEAKLKQIALWQRDLKKDEAEYRALQEDAFKDYTS